LLDWVLPQGSGLDLLKRIRANRVLALVPVIMLTAKNEEMDKLQGLLSGADDYVTKPFSFAELEARIQSVLRRAARVAPSYSDDHLEIVPLRKRLHVKGEARHLGQYEWAALELLLLSDGTVSREDLFTHVWGETPPASTRSLDTLMLKLRKIIEPEEAPIYILSERGVGYRFVRYDKKRGAST
jgi:DNA-binding response OmpR family regulator